MVPITSLILPIIVSAVVVFVVSSIIHMVLNYHRNDYRAVPNEDAVQESLRAANLPPGDYALPYAGSAQALKDPGFMARMERGPVVIMTVVPPGPPQMGNQLVQWFVYSLVVGVFAAYIASRALPAGAEFTEVLRFAGTTAFAGYALALAQGSIWYRRNWAATLRSMFDGLLYAVGTGLVFAWLWPG